MPRLQSCFLSLLFAAFISCAFLLQVADAIPMAPGASQSQLQARGKGKCKAKLPALSALKKSHGKKAPAAKAPVSGKKKIRTVEARAHTVLYHITDATDAATIKASGPKLITKAGDFTTSAKPGFYLGDNKADLIKWCKEGQTGMGRAKKCTHLLEFHYTTSSSLKVHIFNKDKLGVDAYSDTDDFCVYNEFAGYCMASDTSSDPFPKEVPATLKTDDIIIGPLVDHYHITQYAFRSTAALAALGPVIGNPTAV